MSDRVKKAFAAGACFLVLLAVLMILLKTVDIKPIGPVGTEVGLAGINGFFAKHFGYNAFWYHLSGGLGIAAILSAALFAALGVYQLIRGKSLGRVDRQILLLGILYLVVIILYLAFEKIPFNYRPVLLEDEPEPSFPSSHTMLTCTVMGSAIIIFGHLILDGRLRKICRVVAAVIMVLTVLARLFSGVHWFTDILGGILVSAALVFLYYGVFLRVEEQKNRARKDGRQTKGR